MHSLFMRCSLRRCWILLCGSALAASSAFALPANCVSATFDTYISQGSCQNGDATFSNFSGLSFTNSGGVPDVPASQILVTPGGTVLAPTLTFEYLDSTGAPAPVSVGSAGQIFSMAFTYNIDLASSTLSSIQMGETFSNTTPGSVSATKNASLLGGSSFTSTVNDGGVSNPAGTSLLGGVIPTSGTGTWHIQDTVSLQAQTGVATQNSFENLFTLTPSATTPEPGTLLLIGSGLLGLGFIRRRSKSVQS